MLQLNFVVRALIKMVFGATLGPGSHAVRGIRSTLLELMVHSVRMLRPLI
jgi:hypothetical protein